MRDGQTIPESKLAEHAKEARKKTGLTQTEAAERLGVARPSLAQAENEPERSMLKLRLQMIKAFAGYRAEGPFWRFYTED